MRTSPLFFLVAALIFQISSGGQAATTIPFQFQSGLIWLKVSAGEPRERLDFIFDTGAGSSVIDLQLARRMGLKLGEQKTVKRVDGSSPSFRVKEFSALVGEIPISSSLLAMDLSGPSRSCHRRIDGIVGVDFIRNRIVQIDFARQILRLLEPAEATTAGYEMIPLAARNDTLCARVSVNGRAAQWLRLDTGCNTSVEWVARDTRSIGRNATTIGVNLKMADEILTEIQIGAKRIASVKTGIHGRPFFPGEFGLIGNGLLSHFVVTIDAANRRCLLAEQ